MVGRRGRWGKRKMDDFQDDPERKSKPAKEARIEAISLDASEPAHITLHTLRPDHWDHQEAGEEWSEDHNSRVSQPVEGEGGVVSQGTCWTGILDPPPSQVALGCRRVSNGTAFDCETQTYHFSRVSVSKVVVVPDSDTLETIKVEIDTDQQEEFLSHPLVCCVEGCAARSDADTTASFFTVPRGKDRFFWSEMLDIIPSEEGDVRRHVCGQHFITPAKVPPTKGKTRKKKTCDMLVAEEAEIIRQGLTSGRPKRTPKLNKNYDWVEIAPLIKSEPDEVFEESHLSSAGAVSKPGATVTSAQKHPSYTREDKENKKPSSDTEEDPGEMEEEEEEEEEDWENISQPSHPRAPPPKPKGRPHRIRDSGTQTEGACNSSGPRLPLREVKVQCNMSSEPPSPCTSCSYVNWLRLEELLVDCASRMEGDLCAPEVQECFRQVVDSVPHPTHATNVLKLLSGDRIDALEDTGDIVLVPNEEDEVEIENVIHTAVEEPITGLREIIPQTWQKKRQLKQEKGLTRVVPLRREEEEDLDGFGIREATEIDDEEFYPEYFEGEETEDDEDDQGLLDDEDWTIKKEDKDFRSGGKKKQKKAYQQPKAKKEHMVSAGEGGGAGEDSSGKTDDGSVSPRMPDTSQGRRRRKEGDTRWIRKPHACNDCGLMFTTQKKFDQHFNHMHLGIAPWHGEHKCDDCGKTFTQKISLNVHRMFKHGAPRRYQCSQCVYEAPTKEYLKRHMKVHTNERRYVCPHCQKALKTAESYRNHLVIHTNKGRFICQVCQKAYNHKGAYQDHIRTHCEHRDYACDYCGAAFKAYKHVARHIRAVHLNDKRFICDVCGAQHMTGFNLKGHIKKHGDLSSLSYAYECNICEAKFRGPDGRAVHMKVVHLAPATTPANPKKPEGNEKVPKKDDKTKLVSPHPTRRPVQFHYSKLSRDDKVLTDAGNSDGSDNWGTIYLDNTGDFSPFDGKEDESVVYEVYSGGEEDELEKQFDKLVNEKSHNTQELAASLMNSKDRVIHVYPCSACHIMFTSRGVMEEHYETCQQREEHTKEEIEHTKEEIVNTEEEIESSKDEIESSKDEIDSSKDEIEHSKEEIVNTKVEIEDSKEEIEHTNEEIVTDE